METKKYFIMTSEQKEMLEEILKALDIDIEAFLLVGNMKEYDNKIKACLFEIEHFKDNLIQLNNRIADIETKLIENEAQTLFRELGQNDE